ncbi:TolC family protein [Leadbettera azotonutricia]|uniref:Outer membrane efflux protein n=1 Tax=Leadbettera azotonutricia (strain ATCC BAA-888 / DSM 13862 / ZAS-9) TaxID=545695 RepID=F5Y6N0_LEAAZ|nr:TolC family protein [Leadbettera azotonutricia]AEF83402.1 outer membrane efflux protein [Leadbettera azotonutricia ZAS-9]
MPKPKLLPLMLMLFVVPRILLAGDLSLGFADAGKMAQAASRELWSEYQKHYLKEGAWAWGLRAYFPRLSVTVSEDDRLSLVNADSFLKNYTLNIEQLLFDGGRTSMSRKLEKAKLKLESTALERMAAEISEGAVAAYRQVILYRKVLEVRERALESLEEQGRILNSEVELGLALALDMAGAGITINQAKIEIASVKLNLIEAEKQLAEALGLNELPLLMEEIDIHRMAVRLSPEAVKSIAEARNPGMAAARHSIAKRQVEAKYAALSWIPTLRLTGSVGLGGQHYPLTRHNWSIGISVDFSSPWISGNLNGSAGWEPPYDRSARLQNTLSPLPDPAQAYTARNTLLALNLEKSNYDINFMKLGRAAVDGVEKCSLLEKKRALAVETLELEREKYRLGELKLDLGKLTRLELMDARLDYAEKEIAAVEAAIALLEGERELEKLLDFSPGELYQLADLVLQ